MRELEFARLGCRRRRRPASSIARSERVIVGTPYLPSSQPDVASQAQLEKRLQTPDGPDQQPGAIAE